jgi:hypothetical protein
MWALHWPLFFVIPAKAGIQWLLFKMHFYLAGFRPSPE